MRLAGQRAWRPAPVWELPRKEVIQPHLPVRLPCYDFTPITSPTFDGSLPEGWVTGFGCCPLSWCDGRWVQDPGTYSPRRCGSGVTSTSAFMEASFSLQSEPRPAFWDSLHLAVSQPP